MGITLLTELDGDLRKLSWTTRVNGNYVVNKAGWGST